MRDRDFVLAEVEEGWRHPIQKRVLQFDLLFLNRTRRGADSANPA
jgi:hypothetical protein